jgi:hypothetical protein
MQFITYYFDLQVKDVGMSVASQGSSSQSAANCKLVYIACNNNNSTRTIG